MGCCYILTEINGGSERYPRNGKWKRPVFVPGRLLNSEGRISPTLVSYTAKSNHENASLTSAL